MKSADFEESLCNDENELTILKKLQELGNKYYFSELYEQDLQLLWGVYQPVRSYCKRSIHVLLTNQMQENIDLL